MVEKKTEEVSFLGLYDEDGSHQNQFTMTETLMDKINKAMENPIEPMVWMINKSKNTHFIVMLYQFTEQFTMSVIC